mmetsp:Transcript_42959/g.139399  ORF Transcript_42959/g.139399 Transcript_42959/m.139399 type:complete len:216 (-) Transcript_42959:774-1421(-)
MQGEGTQRAAWGVASVSRSSASTISKPMTRLSTVVIVRRLRKASLNAGASLLRSGSARRCCSAASRAKAHHRHRVGDGCVLAWERQAICATADSWSVRVLGGGITSAVGLPGGPQASAVTSRSGVGVEASRGPPRLARVSDGPRGRRGCSWGGSPQSMGSGALRHTLDSTSVRVPSLSRLGGGCTYHLTWSGRWPPRAQSRRCGCARPPRGRRSA